MKTMRQALFDLVQEVKYSLAHVGSDLRLRDAMANADEALTFGGDPAAPTINILEFQYAREEGGPWSETRRTDAVGCGEPCDWSEGRRTEFADPERAYRRNRVVAYAPVLPEQPEHVPLADTVKERGEIPAGARSQPRQGGADGREVWVVHSPAGLPVDVRLSSEEAHGAVAHAGESVHAYVPAESRQQQASGWVPVAGDELVSVLTAAMREADRAFEKVGGSTRHHVRDCLIPVLERMGLAFVSRGAVQDAALPPPPAEESKP